MSRPSILHCAFALAFISSSGACFDGSASGRVPLSGATVKRLWLDSAEISRLPVSGAAWVSLRSAADRDCGTPALEDQDQSTNVCIMAKALVFARTGEPRYREAVAGAIGRIAQSRQYRGRALSLGRELGAYVIAADLIHLSSHDPRLDSAFRRKLIELRSTETEGGPKTLVECHERRPNNWGTHCGASRAAIAAYLGDKTELQRVAVVLRGYLGDRASYDGFTFGDDRSWQCDAGAPVGINPPGCTKNGVVLDGVLPDDQRRGGALRWPAPKEPYVYEALQGAIAQAMILSRQGYPAFEWGDRAFLRAFRWLNETNRFPASGDDAWQAHVINRIYGTSFVAETPAPPGKNIGWTDWTHGVPSNDST